eukprot:jgi/Mesvir1/27158/Mv20822-RA.1
MAGRGLRLGCRYARNSCSLSTRDDGDILEKSCKLRSEHGHAGGLYRLMFGETNCTFTLEDCVSDVCYSFRDGTQNLPQDQIPRPLPSSFFSSIQVVSGASSAKWTRDGFAFKATDDKVVLQYSTHTCAAFYAYRGREPLQLCTEPILAITQVDSGLPISLDCA